MAPRNDLGDKLGFHYGAIYCPFKDSGSKSYIPGMFLGTRVLKWAVYGPFGFCTAAPKFNPRPFGHAIFSISL